MAGHEATLSLEDAFKQNGFQGSPPGLARLIRGFTIQQGETAKNARRRIYRRIYGILWFGNRIGQGMFRDGGNPTYVYLEALKAAIRERLDENLREYPDPETPAVYRVTIRDLHQARWPGDN